MTDLSLNFQHAFIDILRMSKSGGTTGNDASGSELTMKCRN